MFSWYLVMDLARAPRRAARKKGSGYENDLAKEERQMAKLIRAVPVCKNNYKLL
jgi:hypothetical protein